MKKYIPVKQSKKPPCKSLGGFWFKLVKDLKGFENLLGLINYCNTSFFTTCNPPCVIFK